MTTVIRRNKRDSLDPVLLLEENLRSYESMLGLARKRHGEILNGEGDSFAESIDRCRQIQEEISSRDRIIEQTRDQLPYSLTDPKLSNLVKQCAATILAIQEVDRKTLSLMQEECERLRVGLETMRRGKRSLRTYGKGTPSIPRFVDRRG